MPLVSSANAHIHYDVVGKGDPVVLLHGLFSDGEEWIRRGMVQALGDDFSFVLIDALGHGESDKPHDRHRYELAARVQDVVSVLDDIGVEKAHIAGYSMGGWTACGLAEHAPQRCQSLVVGGWDPVGGIRLFLKTAFEQSGIAMTYDRLLQIVSVDPDLAANIESGDDAAFRLAYAVLNDFMSAERALVESSVPVLFYCGDRDPYFDPTRAASARIPGSSFLSVPDSDHVAVSQRVDVVAPAIRSFLDNMSLRGQQ
jgi:pimeloyl-ACP methyl ester carboxylesterase